MSTFRLTELSGETAQAAGSSVFRLTALTGAAPLVTLSIDGPSSTVEPFDPITLSANTSGTPSSYLWEQTGGVPVAMSGTTGPLMSFEAPAERDTPVDVDFMLTVTPGDVTATFTVTTWPATEFYLAPSKDWVPYRERLIGP